MTTRLCTAALLALLAAPALAQGAPDFGTDSSAWANDGQCDDPRFQGPGVAAVTVEEDRLADATDCRAAFEAGTAQLVAGADAGTAPAQPAPPAAPAAPGKGGTAPAAPAQTAAPATTSAAPAAVDFGDDSGPYANDGECDDRRFAGAGMATVLSWASVGRDASDCQPLHQAGQIRVWSPVEAQAATQCASIDFGDDAGPYANDGECDDLRFEGLGAASTLSGENNGGDATDCRQLCTFGSVALRDY